MKGKSDDYVELGDNNVLARPEDEVKQNEVDALTSMSSSVSSSSETGNKSNQVSYSVRQGRVVGIIRRN